MLLQYMLPQRNNIYYVRQKYFCQNSDADYDNNYAESYTFMVLKCF
jgi:hypothetical protein